MNIEHYSRLATLFDYPDDRFPAKVREVIAFLDGHNPAAASEVKAFYAGLAVDEAEKMRELFTRSFDVQAITTLDIGYVLFGDDYKRGELLANLNREHLKAENDCQGNLADHLPNILRLMPRLDDDELLRELVGDIVVPSLQKMIAEFDPGRVDKKAALYKKHYKTLIEKSQDDSTIYRCLLQALYIVLMADFDLQLETVESEHGQDFLKSVGEEMVVEKVASN